MNVYQLKTDPLFVTPEGHPTVNGIVTLSLEIAQRCIYGYEVMDSECFTAEDLRDIAESDAGML